MSVNLVCLMLLFAGCLVPDLAAQSGASRKWVCTGEITQYTDSDCEQQGAVKKMAVDGCFLVPGLSQYKSCGLTCNDALVGSVKESRCDSDCAHYLDNNCEKKTVEQKTSPTKPAAMNTGHVVVAAAVPSVVVIVLVVAFGVYRCYKKKKIRSCKKDAKQKSSKNGNGAGAPPPGSGQELSAAGNPQDESDADHVKEDDPLLSEAGAAGESKPSPSQVDEKYKTMTQDTDSSLTVDVHVPDGTQTPITEEQPSEETQTPTNENMN